MALGSASDAATSATAGAAAHNPDAGPVSATKTRPIIFFRIGMLTPHMIGFRGHFRPAQRALQTAHLWRLTTRATDPRHAYSEPPALAVPVVRLSPSCASIAPRGGRVNPRLRAGVSAADVANAERTLPL